jgi:hypothetical protein
MMFGNMKQNFSVGTRVIIGNVGAEMDDQTGVILGKSFVDVFDSYIVLLDIPASNGDKAIVLTETCLSITNRFS